MLDFSKIRTSDLWYVIGYITTDGYLSNDKRHINITSKDRAHLLLIRDRLKLKTIVGRKSRSGLKDKKYSQLQFSDVKFYKYLERLGLHSKKSLTLAEIKIDQKYFIDFLRGVIDGDGNISRWVHKTNRRTQWTLRIYSASKIFLDWLASIINAHFGQTGKIYARAMINRKNNIYVLKFGKLAAIPILRRIYYTNCLALERKYQKAILCLQ